MNALIEKTTLEEEHTANHWCNKRSHPMKSAAKVKILSQLGHPNFFWGRNDLKQPKMQYKQKKVFW